MEVERGVPLPHQARRVSKYRLPLGEMEVGDSFYLTVKEDNVFASVRSLISRYGKTFGRRYATRVQDGGFRVWRIE